MKRKHVRNLSLTVGLLLAVGVLDLGISRLADAAESTSLRDKTWTWGYVIEGELPAEVPFVSSWEQKADKFKNKGKSSCSLETGTRYMRTPNTMFLNSHHDIKSLNSKNLAPLSSCKRVVCALTQGDHQGYLDSAKLVSALSKKHPNITGAIIDDFFTSSISESSDGVETLKAINAALKSENPSLKLYVVWYEMWDQNLDKLMPFLPHFDEINFWVWKTNETHWIETVEPQIDKIAKLTGKPITLGLYLFDYGINVEPMPMNILKLQFIKAAELTKKGKIEGFVILQNGWFDQEYARPQIQWVKQYMDWLFDTETVRK